MVHGEHNSPGAKKVWVYFSLGPARVRAWLLVILSVPVPAAPGVSPLIETHRLKFGKIATRDGTRQENRASANANSPLPGKGSKGIEILFVLSARGSAGHHCRVDSQRVTRVSLDAPLVSRSAFLHGESRRWCWCWKPRRKLQRHDGAAAPVRGQIDIFAESAAAV